MCVLVLFLKASPHMLAAGSFWLENDGLVPDGKGGEEHLTSTCGANKLFCPKPTMTHVTSFILTVCDIILSDRNSSFLLQSTH